MNMDTPQKRLIVDLNRALFLRDTLYKLVQTAETDRINVIKIKNEGWNEALRAMGSLLVENCEEEKD